MRTTPILKVFIRNIMGKLIHNAMSRRNILYDTLEAQIVISFLLHTYLDYYDFQSTFYIAYTIKLMINNTQSDSRGRTRSRSRSRARNRSRSRARDRSRRRRSRARSRSPSINPDQENTRSSSRSRSRSRSSSRRRSRSSSRRRSRSRSSGIESNVPSRTRYRNDRERSPTP